MFLDQFTKFNTHKVTSYTVTRNALTNIGSMGHHFREHNNYALTIIQSSVWTFVFLLL